jgi:hypothetical protein
MLPASEADSASIKEGTTDLFFKCEHCGIPLVVDRAAAGMRLTCQRCGHPTAVPALDSGGAPMTLSAETIDEKTADLKRRLRENESQRTEITSYINQLNIQLHRWQLRFQTLDERNAELKAELAALAPEAPAAR